MSEWKRQTVPAPKTLVFGVWMLLIAGIGLFIGFVMMTSEDSSPFEIWMGMNTLYASSGLLGVSVLTILTGLIIKEMRQAAYEAALRAGEVDVVLYKDLKITFFETLE